MTFGLLIAVVLDAFSKYLGSPEETENLKDNAVQLEELH
jgi:hypothetical protein